MKKRFKIEELYKTAKQSNVALLPVNTNFSWWEEYENNTSIYDRYILDTFRNFYYWVVFNGSTPAEVLEDFKEAITSFLTINQKRYSELYRLHVLPDSAYDIVNNYSVTENSTRTITEGARTDSDTANLGEREDTGENKISAYNSSTYQDANEVITTTGAQENVVTSVKGEQENVDEYELTRAGNIGVQTPADVIGGHLDLWDRFNFYKQIFDEIAKAYFVCQNRHRQEALMQISLFTYTKEKERVNKTDYLTNRFPLNGYLKNETSVKEPVILIEKTNPALYDYNYLYIEDFKRFYFITGIKQIRQNLWEISAKCDVLYSFMNDILANKCIIDKAENSPDANLYLNDGSFVTDSRKYNEVIPFASGLSLNGSYILICAGGNGNNGGGA